MLTPRINPLMVVYQELPGKRFGSQGPFWPAYIRSGWAEQELRVSPRGVCAECGVQHRWPGHQGLMEDVDDRPGSA